MTWKHKIERIFVIVAVLFLLVQCSPTEDAKPVELYHPKKCEVSVCDVDADSRVTVNCRCQER